MNSTKNFKSTLLTLTALTALTINASAANKTKPAKKTKATTSTMAPSAATTPSAAPMTQTSTASVADVKPESSKKWGASIAADLETPKEALFVENEDAELTNTYILKGKYELSKNLSLFVRPSIVQKVQTRTANDNPKENSTQLADFVIGANQSMENVWSVFPKLSMEHRLYLPTSNPSKNDGAIARYVGLYGAPFAITPKLEVSYNLWPDARAYSSAGAKSGARFSITHFGEVAYNLTETVAIAQDIGLTHSFNTLTNTEISRNTENLLLTSAIMWAPNKTFTGILQLNEQKDILNGNYENGLYQSKDSTIELYMVVAI